MNQIGDKLGNNEVLKTLTKTLTFVDADTNANADTDTGGSTIALRERCSGEFCLCWGFTAQSTEWGHVERSQFT